MFPSLNYLGAINTLLAALLASRVSSPLEAGGDTVLIIVKCVTTTY